MNVEDQKWENMQGGHQPKNRRGVDPVHFLHLYFFMPPALPVSRGSPLTFAKNKTRNNIGVDLSS